MLNVATRESEGLHHQDLLRFVLRYDALRAVLNKSAARHAVLGALVLQGPEARLTVQQLADMCRRPRPTIYRGLGELESEGLVDFGDRGAALSELGRAYACQLIGEMIQISLGERRGFSIPSIAAIHHLPSKERVDINSLREIRFIALHALRESKLDNQAIDIKGELKLAFPPSGGNFMNKINTSVADVCVAAQLVSKTELRHILALAKGVSSSCEPQRSESGSGPASAPRG